MGITGDKIDLFARLISVSDIYDALVTERPYKKPFSPRDAATGEQLTFKNILVQNTFHEELGEGYLAFQCHDTTRDGWFFTNGRGIHVNWEKTSDYSATRYYDDNGDEIILNTGKTMICIIEDGDSFTFH